MCWPWHIWGCNWEKCGCIWHYLDKTPADGQWNHLEKSLSSPTRRRFTKKDDWDSWWYADWFNEGCQCCVYVATEGNESCQESTGTKPTTEGSGLAGSVRTAPGLGACGGRTYWMLLQPSINIFPFPCPRVLDPSISIPKYPSLLVPSSPLWAESPMMAIMASRPLLISAVKLFFFFSGS